MIQVGWQRSARADPGGRDGDDDNDDDDDVDDDDDDDDDGGNNDGDDDDCDISNCDSGEGTLRW